MEDNENIDRDKINKFFDDIKKPTKEVTPVSDTRNRLKSLKDQIEDVKQESELVVMPTGLTKVNKTVVLTDLTPEQTDFIELMIPMSFHVTNICNEIGISRTTYYNWMNENPAFKTAEENTREAMTDRAEQVLYDALNIDNPELALKVLKALHKRYKDKIDITSNGQTMGSIINILPPHEKRD